MRGALKHLQSAHCMLCLNSKPVNPKTPTLALLVSLALVAFGAEPDCLPLSWRTPALHLLANHPALQT